MYCLKRMPTDTSKVHILPCCIDFNGPADVDGFFQRKILVTDEERGEVNASLRGRPLEGMCMELPNEWIGIVVEEDEEHSETLKVEATFDRLTYWKLDEKVTENDQFVKIIDLLKEMKQFSRINNRSCNDTRYEQLQSTYNLRDLPARKRKRRSKTVTKRRKLESETLRRVAFSQIQTNNRSIELYQLRLASMYDLPESPPQSHIMADNLLDQKENHQGLLNDSKKGLRFTPPRKSSENIEIAMQMPLQPSPGFFKNSTIDSVYRQNVHNSNNIISKIFHSGMSLPLCGIFQRLSNADLLNVTAVCHDWLHMMERFFEVKRPMNVDDVTDSRKRQFADENVQDQLNEHNSSPKRRKSARLAERRKAVAAETFTLSDISNKFARSSPKNDTTVKHGRNMSEKPIRSLLKPKYPDRVYIVRKCPICERKALCDMTYHKGICPYRSCGIEFCTTCNLQYHPLISCIQMQQRSSEIQPPEQKD